MTFATHLGGHAREMCVVWDGESGGDALLRGMCSAACRTRAVDGPRQDFRSTSIGGPDDLTRLETIDLLERALGVQAGRSHVPVGMMRVIKRLSWPVNPSLSYLVEAALMEETHPEVYRYAPGDDRLVGPTTVGVVIEEWARG